MRDFSKKVLWQGKFLRIVSKEFTNKKGALSTWECAERTTATEIVAIFAVAKDRELVLTKQFRFPLESYVVELPVGLADKKGESLEKLASRELLEETGYQASKLLPVHQGPFNSGMTNDELVVFYAPAVEYVGFDNVESDDSEEIEVIKVPIRKLVDFCAKQHKDFKIDLKILGTLKILEEQGLI